MRSRNLFVCGGCFEDLGLVEFIEDNASAEECSFCATRGAEPIAAPMREVSEYFIECLFREYDLAVNALGWIGSEGGYFGKHWYAEELVFDVLEMEFPKENHEQLVPELLGAYYEEEWCERDPYGLNDQERTRYGWDRFCQVVMHERRYFFLGEGRDEDDPDVYSPGEVLDAIFEYAQQMGIFRQLLAGTHLVRARFEGDGLALESPEDLGPPPSEKANQSNRMSPAGIPMFYACEDEETALRETACGSGRFALGRFETLKPITILDLTDIPPIPSLFARIPDSAEVYPRTALRFLHHVAREMSSPIERDDRVHVSYVPTQVVTEFIRDRVTWGDTPIEGIRYRSSVHPGHYSYVLFAEQGDVESTSQIRYRMNPWLRLVGVIHRPFHV